MKLTFQSLSPRGETCEFEFVNTAGELEELTDLIDIFVRSGHHLFWASLTDEHGHCSSLPIDAFDGRPIAIHFFNLKQEWEQVLVGKSP